MPAKRKSKSPLPSRQVARLAKVQLRSDAERLRDRQKEEARDLKQRQKDARARQRKLDKIARVRLVNIHKAQRKRAAAQRKEVRRRAAILKSKGLIRPEIDIRSLAPSKKTRSLFKKFAKILEGKETTYKVPPERVRELKEQGYTIENGRIVLSKSLKSRGGKIYTAAPTAAKSTRLETFKLGRNFEVQIKAAFETLKPGEFIGFNIEGHNSYDLYQVAEPMIEKINQYLQAKVKISQITIFRVEDTAAYTAQRRAERKATETARGKRKRERAKARKFRKGLIVMRDH